ncbi:MAG: hypothetical protein ACREGA_03050 [Candidatus Saccharimonadales bacterium]
MSNVNPKTVLYSLLGALAVIVILGVGVVVLVLATSHANRAVQPQSKPKTSSSEPQASSYGGQTSQGLSLNVVRAMAVGLQLQVGTQISGATSGTCTLAVSQSGQKDITAQESVVLQENAYVCPEFDVPLSKFPNQNLWNVGVTLTAGGKTLSSLWQNNPVNLSAS